MYQLHIISWQRKAFRIFLDYIKTFWNILEQIEIFQTKMDFPGIHIPKTSHLLSIALTRPPFYLIFPQQLPKMFNKTAN